MSKISQLKQQIDTFKSTLRGWKTPSILVDERFTPGLLDVCRKTIVSGTHGFHRVMCEIDSDTQGLPRSIFTTQFPLAMIEAHPPGSPWPSAPSLRCWGKIELSSAFLQVLTPSSEVTLPWIIPRGVFEVRVDDRYSTLNVALSDREVVRSESAFLSGSHGPPWLVALASLGNSKDILLSKKDPFLLASCAAILPQRRAALRLRGGLDDRGLLAELRLEPGER